MKVQAKTEGSRRAAQSDSVQIRQDIPTVIAAGAERSAGWISIQASATGGRSYPPGCDCSEMARRSKRASSRPDTSTVSETAIIGRCSAVKIGQYGQAAL